MDKKILLTSEKKSELELELNELETKKLPEISSYLEHARQSDLSEDTDDLSVMLEEKESADDRIEEIKEILANCEVIEKTECKDIATIGSEIKVEFKGKAQSFKIVNSLEADPMKGYISDKSPLGKALLKAKKNETIKVKVHGNVLEYKVLEIC